MKLAIGTAVIGATFLLLAGPVMASEEPTLEEVRANGNYGIASQESGTYAQFASTGTVEDCMWETWAVPYEYDSINEYIAAEPDAAPRSVVPSQSPVGCEKNSDPAKGDLPFTPADYGYQFGLREIDFLIEPIA